MLSVILHLLHDFWKFQMFLGCLPSFFFAIRICGLGLWPNSTTACPVSYYTCCTSSSFQFFFVWGHAWWRRSPTYTVSQCCTAALRRHITSMLPGINISAVGHRPYHVECTGSLLTSKVKRHRARLVLGWGAAWGDLRVLPAQSDPRGQDQEKQGQWGRGRGKGEGEGEGEEAEAEAEASWPLPLPLPLPPY